MRTDQLTSLSLAVTPPGYFVALKTFLAGTASRYAFAVALLIAAVLLFAGAMIVSLSALHHWLALSYGPYVAFAAIGGGLALVAFALGLVGYLLLRQPVRLPKPQLGSKAISHAVVAPLLQRARALRQPADGITQLAAAAAALLLLSWTVRSFLSKHPDD